VQDAKKGKKIAKTLVMAVKVAKISTKVETNFYFVSTLFYRP